jgi:cytochrome c oxidase subunit 2
MKSISKIAALLVGGRACPAPPAVQDLPGGPGVRQLNLHAAATRIASSSPWLHWFMLITCIVIFIAVFSVMFYSIWKHRKSVGHKPANFHESVTWK